MKRTSLLFSFLMMFGLLSCNGNNAGPVEKNEWTQSVQSGELGSFSLLSPEKDANVEIVPTFTWESSANASYYLLEVASTPDFVTNDAAEVYLKRGNIATTSFSLTSSLTKKNCTYYWKVTAFNSGKSKLCNEVSNFYYAASNAAEIEIEIEDREDWALHEQGSYATIAIDDSNFFGNGKKSLAISFEKEDTNQGIPTSDGWMVVTKTEERDLYGTDALYFNFYYSGNDAQVSVRIVDNDGEYWHCPVQISNNAKQAIILNYSQFILRTKDTPVMNQTFDTDHIKYFEIVIEKAFGDGVALFSDFRAVSYANYADKFVSKLNFNSFEPSDWGYEAYHFIETVSPEGNELKLEYSTSPNANNDKGIGSYGYGFTRLAMNRYFAKGNAIKMSIRYTGYYSSSANVVFRILEQDNDRWQYKQSLSAFTEGEFSTVVIPFEAMLKTDYIYGDGARQFYYILNLQFGINGLYGSGSLTFKDVEIVDKADHIDSTPRVVSSDGVIDDFDHYRFNTELYYKWDISTDNKDESMQIDTAHKAKGTSNAACARVEYKSDMGMATYSTFLDNQMSEDSGNALRIWLMDNSTKKDAIQLNYLEDVSATCTIQLSLKTGEFYRYVIPHVATSWTEYTLSFADFYLENAADFKEEPEPLKIENIINFGLGFQYFYYLENGTPYPVYTSSNGVYLDEIGFTKAEKTVIAPITKILGPSSTDPATINIDDMEYGNNEELLASWTYGNEVSFRSMSLSNDVSSEGGSSSLRLAYHGSTSPNYTLQTNFTKDSGGKGLIFDMKGDGLVKVYINIYARIGSQLYQYRLTLNNVAASWRRYTYGFDSFIATESTNTNNLRTTLVPSIEKITFGAVGSDSNPESAFYVDNMKFSTAISYGAAKSAAI